MTLQEFIIALNAKFNGIGYTFAAERKNGAKYFRVSHELHNTGKSVFCFVDVEGNIYKSASWKAPAKGVRSTLATVDMSKVDPYGSWLYR